ncbi:MAG: transketolase [Omnitrophica bacterium RIFCSPLOWO2_01_FULL_45_10]|nr:MAG: transketolase [Omnitrophica bacterium RIFCSPLOWO2_01_FULL_45_10]
MKKENLRAMRDVFIEELCNRMENDRDIFFVCADFGSPKLDRLRSSFKDRFINVGIAEQDLINISTGLALEGFTVYAYAIAPFLTMRPYEQIRINLSMQSQLKEVNVNLVGVGAGLSYDVSGPTHHCLEDISIMRVLPNIEIFSPSDWVLAGGFVDYSIRVKKPKYLRFDGKPLPPIYEKVDIDRGFSELKKGKDLCIVSTGYMTHKALTAVEKLSREGIDAGLLDIFMLRPLDEELLFNILRKYRCVLTIEEGFINKAGLDSIVLNGLNKKSASIKLRNIGFNDAYIFDIGSRDHLHELNGLGIDSIVKDVKALLG